VPLFTTSFDYIAPLIVLTAEWTELKQTEKDIWQSSNNVDC